MKIRYEHLPALRLMDDGCLFFRVYPNSKRGTYTYSRGTSHDGGGTTGFVEKNKIFAARSLLKPFVSGGVLEYRKTKLAGGAVAHSYVFTNKKYAAAVRRVNFRMLIEGPIHFSRFSEVKLKMMT